MAEYGWKPRLVVAGSDKPVAGLVILAHARTTEGYGFIEFESSNSTISTVFRQPLVVASRRAGGTISILD